MAPPPPRSLRLLAALPALLLLLSAAAMADTTLSTSTIAAWDAASAQTLARGFPEGSEREIPMAAAQSHPQGFPEGSERKMEAPAMRTVVQGFSEGSDGNTEGATAQTLVQGFSEGSQGKIETAATQTLVQGFSEESQVKIESVVADSSAFSDDSPQRKRSREGCPVTCFRAAPVCGTNGATYWCGSKEAECDGVQVMHEGYCSLGNGGSSGRGVMAGQALLLIHMVWLILAGILVIFGLP